MLRVLHLTGSPVSPFFAELSTVYGRGCLGAAADPARYEFLVAHVTPDGRWRFPADLTPEALAAAPRLGLPEALGLIESRSVDVAVPQLFCPPGMTTYRALLDALGVPYPGNPPDVMALGADKAMTRAVVAAAGVPVPEGRVVTSADPCPLPPPFVVKPVDADNSDGLTLVHDRADYTRPWTRRSPARPAAGPWWSATCHRAARSAAACSSDPASRRRSPWRSTRSRPASAPARTSWPTTGAAPCPWWPRRTAARGSSTTTTR